MCETAARVRSQRVQPAGAFGHASRRTVTETCSLVINRLKTAFITIFWNFEQLKMTGPGRVGSEFVRVGSRRVQ